MSHDHDAVARRTTAVLAVLLLFTIGVMLTQYLGVRNFRQQQYRDCLQRVVYDERSQDLRRTEVQRFRELGTITNHALSPEETRQRQEAYNDLANQAEAVLSSAVNVDCGGIQ